MDFFPSRFNTLSLARPKRCDISYYFRSTLVLVSCILYGTLTLIFQGVRRKRSNFSDCLLNDIFFTFFLIPPNRYFVYSLVTGLINFQSALLNKPQSSIFTLLRLKKSYYIINITLQRQNYSTNNGFNKLLFGHPLRCPEQSSRIYRSILGKLCNMRPERLRW